MTGSLVTGRHIKEVGYLKQTILDIVHVVTKTDPSLCGVHQPFISLLRNTRTCTQLPFPSPSVRLLVLPLFLQSLSIQMTLEGSFQPSFTQVPTLSCYTRYHTVSLCNLLSQSVVFRTSKCYVPTSHSAY